MSFQQKNIIVTLTNFSLILFIFVFRVVQMLLTDTFTERNVFWLWAIVIALAVLMTIFATIMTHIFSAVLEAILTQAEPEIEGLQDERDRIIDLRGTRVTYSVYSLGVFVAMLTYALDQPPLVMFTLLILAGIVGQIAGDIFQLHLYRRGF